MNIWSHVRRAELGSGFERRQRIGSQSGKDMGRAGRPAHRPRFLGSLGSATRASSSAASSPPRRPREHRWTPVDFRLHRPAVRADDVRGSVLGLGPKPQGRGRRNYDHSSSPIPGIRATNGRPACTNVARSAWMRRSPPARGDRRAGRLSACRVGKNGYFASRPTPCGRCLGSLDRASRRAERGNPLRRLLRVIGNRRDEAKQ